MRTISPSIRKHSPPVHFRERSLFEMICEKPEIGVQDLTLDFGGKRVLNRITMKAASGEITALVGPRGSGKTVFLRCINRLNELIPGTHVEGCLTIDGLNIYEYRIDSTYLRRLVGLIGSQPNPFPMSVYDNVAYAAQLRNPISERSLDAMVVEALQEVGLRDGSRSALSLSPTDRLRLCIARVLVVRPKILLFDEPYDLPGASGESDIETLIVSLSNRHTILLATRNRKKAERIARRCVAMQSGHLIALDDETERSDHDEHGPSYFCGF